MTVVRYFLRQWMLAWAALLLIGAEAMTMSLRGMQWRGDLVWTIDWLPVSFVIVGPLVAGFSAFETARTSSGAGHLSRQPVVRTPAFAVVLAYSAVMSTAHLLVLVGSLVVSRPPVWDPWAPLAVLCQLLILVLFVAAGSLVGRFVAPILAGIIGALLALVAVYAASSPTRHVTLLETGGATLPRVGYAYEPKYLLPQALVLLLSIVALLLPRPLEGLRLRRLSPRDVTATAVVVVLAAAVSLSVSDVSRLRRIQETPSYCGSVQSIPVCFHPQHKRIEEGFQSTLWVIIEATRDRGYGSLLPSRVEEASRTRLPQADDPTTAPFYVMPDHLQGAKPSVLEVIDGFIQPVHCRQVQGELPPSQRYWDDLRALTSTWASLIDEELLSANGYEGPQLTPEQASTLLREFRTCTYAHF